MTDDEQPDQPKGTDGTETDDQPEAPEGTPDEGDEDPRPDLDDDERAEFEIDEDLAAAIEDEKSGDQAEDGDGEGDTDQSEAPEKAPSEGGNQQQSNPSQPVSWGDMYVDVLGVFLVEIAREKGNGDPDMTQDDIAALATNGPVNLPEQVDALAAEYGAKEDIPPGQAVALGTGMICLTVLMKETDMAGQMVGKMNQQMQGAGA